MYVQIGSENGGVVVNLGIDGVAFHAAHKLTALKNSTFHLRLRGLGLNAELVGELVWLGATQKEAGICFKGISRAVQSDITNWITRETQFFETAISLKPSRPDPSASIAYISGTGDKSADASLSAGSIFSPGVPADPLSSAAAGEDEPRWRAPANPPITSFAATPLQDIASSTQHSRVPGDALEAYAQKYDGDSSALPKESQFNPLFKDDALFEPVPIDEPYQFPTNYSRSITPSDQAMTPAREEPSSAREESSSTRDLRKTEKTQPIAQDRASTSPPPLIRPSAVEQWIPPAIVVFWTRGTRRQKLSLVSALAASLGIIVLTLVMSPFKASTSGAQERRPVQQSTAPPAAVIAPASDSVQTPPAQMAAIEPAPHPTRSYRPPPTLLETFENNFFGEKPEPVVPEIDENQARVKVWTFKSSGYYYCTDDNYYKSVKPGAFMSQGDALQSGYRSILSEFCN